MNPASMMPSGETATAAPAIAHDIPCINCGYNLRGLNPQGVCPECAMSIRVSIRERAGGVSITAVIWARCMIVGLFGWVSFSAMSLTQSLFGQRGGGSYKVMSLDYPGPKLWITRLYAPSLDVPVTDSAAYSRPTLALASLIMVYLITAPRHASVLEPAFSFRKIVRWFCVILGTAAVVGQMEFATWGWPEETPNIISLVGTVLLYVYLTSTSKGLGLKAEGRTLHAGAWIVCFAMIGAMLWRYLFTNNYQATSEWTQTDPVGMRVFAASVTIGFAGAVLAAGTMIRLALAMLPMAAQRRSP